MRFRCVLVLSALALGALVGCSGPDPGIITFSNGSPQGSGSRPDDSDDQDEQTSSSSSSSSSGATPENVNASFANEVYPAVNGPCGSCHLPGTGGAPIFFGQDAASTYALFKENSFHLPESLFVTKGAHLGPALTAEQRAIVDAWVATE